MGRNASSESAATGTSLPEVAFEDAGRRSSSFLVRQGLSGRTQRWSLGGPGYLRVCFGSTSKPV